MTYAIVLRSFPNKEVAEEVAKTIKEIGEKYEWFTVEVRKEGPQ